MTLREAIKPFTDSDGLVLHKPCEGTRGESGNGLLYTGLFYCLLAKYEGIELADAMRSEDVILRCRKLDGTYCRTPAQPETSTAFDDYVGIAACAKRLSMPDVAYNIVNAYKPPIPQCFWMVPFLKVCAGKSLSFIERIRLAAAITDDAIRGNPNGHLLMFLVTEAVAGSSTAIDRAVDFWRKKMRSHYGPIGNMFFDYFDYKSHPFCQLRGEL